MPSPTNPRCEILYAKPDEHNPTSHRTDACYDSLKGAQKIIFPRLLTMVESLYTYLTQKTDLHDKQKCLRWATSLPGYDKHDG